MYLLERDARLHHCCLHRSGRNESFGARIAQIANIDQVENTAEALTRNGVGSGEFSILVAGKKSAGTGGEKFSVLVERIAEWTLNNTERSYTG